MNSQILALGLLLAASGLAAGEAAADTPSPKIAVPSAGADLEGCWSADRMLYGPYQLSFCLVQGASSYTITGGGLDCTSDLAWRRGGGKQRFAMTRATCGNGTDWTADSFTCVTERIGLYGVVKPKVAVPSPEPDDVRLVCTYRPAVAGYAVKRFVAYRD